MECTGNCVQIEEFNETTYEMRENAATLRARIAALESQLADRHAERVSEIDAHMERVAGLEAQLADRDAEIERLRAELARMRSAFADSEHRNVLLHRELERNDGE